MVDVYTKFKLYMHATATVLKAYEPHPTKELCKEIFKTINDDARKSYGSDKFFEIDEWECVEISAELIDENEIYYNIEFSVRGILGMDCAYDEDRETRALSVRYDDEIEDDIDTIWIFPGFDVEFSNIFAEVIE